MLPCQSYIDDQKRKTNTSGKKKKMKLRCGIASRKDFSTREEHALGRGNHILRTKPQTGEKSAKHL